MSVCAVCGASIDWYEYSNLDGEYDGEGWEHEWEHDMDMPRPNVKPHQAVLLDD